MWHQVTPNQMFDSRVLYSFFDSSLHCGVAGTTPYQQAQSDVEQHYMWVDIVVEPAEPAAVVTTLLHAVEDGT